MTKMTKMMKRFKNRCVSCRHWDGDVEAQQADFDKEPVCMDVVGGWSKEGRCSSDYFRWLVEIDVCGDATVTVKVSANFGCILHEPRLK